MLRQIFSIGVLAILLVSIAHGQIDPAYEWTNLDGPYWANSIDVACGTSDDQEISDWYRYMIGNSTDTTLTIIKIHQRQNVVIVPIALDKIQDVINKQIPFVQILISAYEKTRFEMN